MSAAVVGRGDRPETLLARGVPHRQLQSFAGHVHVLELEVHADRRRELLEGVVAEAEEQRGLADAAVAHEKELDGVVEVGGVLPSLIAHGIVRACETMRPLKAVFRRGRCGRRCDTTLAIRRGQLVASRAPMKLGHVSLHS